MKQFTRPDEISELDIKEWLERVELNRSNPVNEEGNCLYTGADGTHCLAGQFFVDHGFELPREGYAADTAPGFSNNTAGDILSRLQVEADLATKNNFAGAWQYVYDKMYGTNSSRFITRGR